MTTTTTWPVTLPTKASSELHTRLRSAFRCGTAANKVIVLQVLCDFNNTKIPVSKHTVRIHAVFICPTTVDIEELYQRWALDMHVDVKSKYAYLFTWRHRIVKSDDPFLVSFVDFLKKEGCITVPWQSVVLGMDSVTFSGGDGI